MNMGDYMVKLDLDSRVNAIEQNFFKKWLGSENYLYQLELCEKLKKKCLNSNRIDLVIELAEIESKGQIRMSKLCRGKKDE